MIGYPFVRYVHDRMAKEITDPYYAALARHLLFLLYALDSGGADGYNIVVLISITK